jgi:hypothetical protein
MPEYALFMNGVFREVLDDIRSVQEHLPDQVLFLQPYTGERIVKFAENPPSSDDPVRMFISITTDLSKVRYTCEIVGWDDKTLLTGRKRELISEIIAKYEPTERGGIYTHGREGGPECRNLLHVRRMQKLVRPFGVEKLIKVSDHTPYSPQRSTSGGWSYVENFDADFLFERIHGYTQETD